MSSRQRQNNTRNRQEERAVAGASKKRKQPPMNSNPDHGVNQGCSPDLYQLLTMGFAKANAMIALRQCNGDLEDAIALLCNKKAPPSAKLEVTDLTYSPTPKKRPAKAKSDSPTPKPPAKVKSDVTDLTTDSPTPKKMPAKAKSDSPTPKPPAKASKAK